MYKPQTVEQFKIYRFLEKQFVMEHFLLSPISRSALMLEDQSGDKIAFSYENGTVSEISIPPPPTPEKIMSFFKEFHSLDPKPILKDFKAITHWWLNNPNPLTYQQALNLNDGLYLHFLSHPLIDSDTAVKLAEKGLVTETEYDDLRLWYRNGNFASCWLGPLGIDGTGYTYGLLLKYGKPDTISYTFYLLNDYYRYMNHISN